MFKRTSSTIAATLGGVIAAASAQAAEPTYNTIPYAKSGLWTIERINDNGKFNYCRAGMTFDNGIDVHFLAGQKIWMVQFYSQTWADRKVSEFEATLMVDGKPVKTAANQWRGRSAFLGVGPSVKYLAPLMRGSVMSVVTAQGRTNFSLKGSHKAIMLANDCLTEGLASLQDEQPLVSEAPPVTSESAFGGPSEPKQQAAAPRAPQPESKPIKLTREQTLDYAKGYLGSTPHEMLAADKAVFKHFPVNWKTTSGVIGGLMIVANTPQTVEQALASLIKDNVESCEGKAAVAKKLMTEVQNAPKGIATATCTTGKGLRVLSFQVLQNAPKTLTIVMEGFFQANAPKVSQSKPKTGLASL